MIGHVEVHQIPERDKYHTYWRLHLNMLMNTIKKGSAQKNISTKSTSVFGLIVRSPYERVSCVDW